MNFSKISGALWHPQRLILALALVLGGLTLVGTAQAQGIAGTPHDLTSGDGQVDASPLGGGSGEICAYCHTPHGGDTAASAPLWNRSLPAAGDFTRYSTLGTTTLRGEETDTGSVSLACLSCHDGTQALDTVINQPGRGDGTATASMTNLNGSTLDNANAVIGVDLQDDHPVGIQYCAGGPDSAAPGAACNDADGFFAPETSSINNNTVWWVDSERDGTTGARAGNGTRERTDMFLYTRNFTDAGSGPSVECGSCHDPHVASARGVDAVDEVNFMRISNQDSAICLTCHNK